MTDAHAARLRELLVAAIAVLDELEGTGAAAVPVESLDHDELVSLSDAAILLGIGYDTLRMRAKRSGAVVKFGDARFVWRKWIEPQLFADRTKSARSVRTL